MSWPDCEQYRKSLYIQEESTYYLNLTKPLIIPMIFIFLSFSEKAYDNK